MAGVLNINKPGGITSHDVVNRVRKLANTRKVGHTGTLDPMATGVLLVCIGPATRLIEYIVPALKQYRAAVRLGITTDTYDAEGRITRQCDPASVTPQDVRRALASFIGLIEQTPPPFSAIKHKGRPLYKLARQGRPVTPAPRPIRIKTIEAEQINIPDVVFNVTGQAGMYVRSLAHDLGRALGVGAHLTALTRLANGPWRVQDAVSLPELAERGVAPFLQPKETLVSHLPAITLSDKLQQRVLHGQTIPGEAPLPDTPLAACDQAGNLIAIMKLREPGWLKPIKVFNPVHP